MNRMGRIDLVDNDPQFLFILYIDVRKSYGLD